MGHEFAMKFITVYFMAHEKSCDRSFMGHESGWWCGLRFHGPLIIHETHHNIFNDSWKHTFHAP